MLILFLRWLRHGVNIDLPWPQKNTGPPVKKTDGGVCVWERSVWGWTAVIYFRAMRLDRHKGLIKAMCRIPEWNLLKMLMYHSNKQNDETGAFSWQKESVGLEKHFDNHRTLKPSSEIETKFVYKVSRVIPLNMRNGLTFWQRNVVKKQKLTQDRKLHRYWLDYSNSTS